MDTNQYLLEDLKNIQELIRFADQKAAALLTIYGLIVTSFVAYSKDLFVTQVPITDWSWHLWFSAILVTLFACIVLYQIHLVMFKVIKPKLAKHYSVESASTFYFEHIANLDKELYLGMVNRLDDDKIRTDLSEQIYEISVILKGKLKTISSSITWLYLSIIALLLIILTTKL
jgi:hypothetical protein